MRILICGGSNTGKREGFAAAIIQRYGAVNIVNRFLGASTSVYGLLMLDRNIPQSNVTHVVFEYAINDASFVQVDAYSIDLLRWALSDACAICAANGVRLYFVIMCPRYCLEDYLAGRAAVVNTYREVAEAFGAGYFDMTGHLLKTRTPEELRNCYADDMHYRDEVARECGEAICDQLSAGRAGLPDAAAGQGRTIRIVPVQEMQLNGEAKPVAIQTAAISGEALKLARGASLEFDIDGQFLGVIANTGDHSGYVRYRAGDTETIKNMFDGFHSPGKARVFLKQMSIPMPSGTMRVKISADVTSDDIARTRPQVSMHNRDPRSRDNEWTAEILSAVYRTTPAP